MTALDVIAQALALSEAATDGPWERADGTNVRAPWLAVDHDDLIADCVDSWDAAFIAAARTLLPAFAKVLDAVLDLAPRDLDESPDYEERLWDQGFNAALGDVRAAITAALSEVTP